MMCTLLLAAAAPSLGAERRITVVVDAQDALKAPVLARLRKAFQGSPLPTIHQFDRSEMSDAIQRGRLLAALQNSDLLVAIGDSATELVLRELEDVSVYFVGGSLIEGGRLASASLAGILSYNVEELLDAAKNLWSGKLGLAYTPGYEAIAASIRSGARTRGFTVMEKKILTLKDIPPAVRELLDQSQIIWIVGDPLLCRGAGFQFLTERALSKQVPIIAAGPWEVSHGAFLAIEPPPDAIASSASDDIKMISGGQDRPETQRIRMAPPGGKIVYNGPLAGTGKRNS
ncbi:MAG: hypothetical protein HY077_12700 [Elusimicrobia bacterium]|nr:hypothetical protein [Elusimicrobiota bacterium]